ncbi:zinc ABC transporter substrate-binding protein [Halarcobacter mediterraneus]|uniref:Zinc ABC transporter substrate-binding protein n=1 Tax=Halarcobacter mediterraneus TaxID=2023153 RepID=A0A4Q1ARM2_9BACT|nr:zinc ABC transporter substrate-binding protein [Halarcobacter mediterraneus]RXK12234.1 zinc ABC transporter substrate-binding protein [Halarcobacter mediterraneus]
MKKILIATLVFTSFVFANVKAVVSIVPQKPFLEAIGGDKVDVTVMVKPGNSPHTYEPKPSQMRELSEADIYFSMGVEFEHSWLPKFANQNKKMKIANMSKGIKRIEMVEHHHGKHEEHEHEEHHDHAHEGHEHEHEGHDHVHDSLDSHVWTSPENVKVFADNILKYLTRVDRENKEYYEKNYNTFLSFLDETDKEIKTIFKDLPKDAKFMVFHPSWGYFAKQYSLIQVPIEVEGKSPKPKEIQELIEHAKKENIKAIFVSPEFSDKVAKQIAKELGIQVISVSPLSEKWADTLIRFAKAIANQQ